MLSCPSQLCSCSLQSPVCPHTSLRGQTLIEALSRIPSHILSHLDPVCADFLCAQVVRAHMPMVVHKSSLCICLCTCSSCADGLCHYYWMFIHAYSHPLSCVPTYIHTYVHTYTTRTICMYVCMYVHIVICFRSPWGWFCSVVLLWTNHASFLSRHWPTRSLIIAIN